MMDADTFRVAKGRTIGAAQPVLKRARLQKATKSRAGNPWGSNQVADNSANSRGGRAFPLLDVVGVHYSYEHTGRWSTYDEGRSALTDISFQMQAGEVLGVLGENGSGKSTLTRIVFQIIRPSRGR